MLARKLREVWWEGNPGPNEAPTGGWLRVADYVLRERPALSPAALRVVEAAKKARREHCRPVEEYGFGGRSAKFLAESHSIAALFRAVDALDGEGAALPDEWRASQNDSQVISSERCNLRLVSWRGPWGEHDKHRDRVISLLNAGSRALRGRA